MKPIYMIDTETTLDPTDRQDTQIVYVLEGEDGERRVLTTFHELPVNGGPPLGIDGILIGTDERNRGTVDVFRVVGIGGNGYETDEIYGLGSIPMGQLPHWVT